MSYTNGINGFGSNTIFQNQAAQSFGNTNHSDATSFGNAFGGGSSISSLNDLFGAGSNNLASLIGPLLSLINGGSSFGNNAGGGINFGSGSGGFPANINVNGGGGFGGFGGGFGSPSFFSGYGYGFPIFPSLPVAAPFQSAPSQPIQQPQEPQLIVIEQPAQQISRGGSGSD